MAAGAPFAITLYSEANYGGVNRGYNHDTHDISGDFPQGVGSCKVGVEPPAEVKVYPLVGYGGEAVFLIGNHPNNEHFPDGIRSLKVNLDNLLSDDEIHND